MKYVFFSLFVALISLSFSAHGGPGLTYQGRLLKPDGKPVTASNVQFRIQIRTESPSSCLMFEETQVKDLSGSLGAFAITVNDGSAVPPNAEPYSLEEVFRNVGSIVFPAGKCAGSNSVAFSSTSSRQIYVSFNDGSFSGWEPLPPQQINFVPMALDSVHFRGRTPSHFFRVENAGEPQAVGAW
ncbi:MAG TPA: hypothetical protein PL182_07705, partial [Pseudobdellovibrionaceae bacterium]|nr:hypothetical protein [Pseudobdellovibrionaceae bacterium]